MRLFVSHNVPTACAAALVLVLANAAVSYVNVERLAANERQVARTHEVLDAIESTVSTLADAETGERGFLLTGDDAYLAPYQSAADELPDDLRRVRRLTADNPEQQASADDLDRLAARKIELLHESIHVRREMGSVVPRVTEILTEGKGVMNDARQVVGGMRAREATLLGVREQESRWSWWAALVTNVLGALLGGGAIGLAYVLFRRDLRARVQAADRLRQANDQLEEHVRRRTAELDRANAELERSNGELQQFASVASHDLQEPLRKIQAFGDRLQARFGAGLDEQGADYLRRMLDAAGRMRGLIDDLLAFTRVATGAQPFAPVDLNRLAAEVVSDLEGRLQQTGGRVEVGALPTVEAEPTQMRQLLQNLIGNALKFHRPGVPPAVVVAGRVVPAAAGAAGPACELTVRDNGIGFEDKYAERIFGVFQRLHGRGEYDGAGMGLAICRKIAERHGGAVTARGTPGEGSTFTVTLPLTQPPPPEEAHDAPSQADHHPDGGRRPGRPGDDAGGVRGVPAGQ
jgi:signal transduction histidine kinase